MNPTPGNSIELGALVVLEIWGVLEISKIPMVVTQPLTFGFVQHQFLFIGIC